MFTAPIEIKQTKDFLCQIKFASHDEFSDSTLRSLEFNLLIGNVLHPNVTTSLKSIKNIKMLQNRVQIKYLKNLMMKCLVVV